jgi:hypothetical protein
MATQMAEAPRNTAIDYQRRRLIGATALTIAATQLDLFATRDARAAAPTSFPSPKQIDAAISMSAMSMPALRGLSKS